MKKLIDLHIHSCYSDGEYNPNEILQLVKENNIKYFSITDHDTILGTKEMSPLVDNELTFIPGIELSAKVNSGTMHILGYNIDVNNNNLNSKLIGIRQNSIDLTKSNIKQLKEDFNIVIPKEDVKGLENALGNVGRPNISKLLLKYGYALTSDEAFRKYLIPVYKKTKSASSGILDKECIDIILEANGVPVLAHPYTLKLNDDELIKTVKKLASFGLQGIETYHSNHSRSQTALYHKIAEHFNLLESAGSDYHGPIIKPKIQMGTGIDNNLSVTSLSIINKLVPDSII